MTVLSRLLQHTVGREDDVNIGNHDKEPPVLPQKRPTRSLLVHEEAPTVPSKHEVNDIAVSPRRLDSRTTTRRAVHSFHHARDQLLIELAAQEREPHPLKRWGRRLCLLERFSCGNTGSPDDANLELLESAIIDPVQFVSCP